MLFGTCIATVTSRSGGKTGFPQIQHLCVQGSKMRLLEIVTCVLIVWTKHCRAGMPKFYIFDRQPLQLLGWECACEVSAKLLLTLAAI